MELELTPATLSQNRLVALKAELTGLRAEGIFLSTVSRLTSLPAQQMIGWQLGSPLSTQYLTLSAQLSSLPTSRHAHVS